MAFKLPGIPASWQRIYFTFIFRAKFVQFANRPTKKVPGFLKAAFLLSKFDNLAERFGVQAGAAHKGAVNVRHLHQR
jgi:hypothetical protein